MQFNRYCPSVNWNPLSLIGLDRVVCSKSEGVDLNDGEKVCAMGFVATLLEAIEYNQRIQIRPDDVWLAILAQFSRFYRRNINPSLSLEGIELEVNGGLPLSLEEEAVKLLKENGLDGIFVSNFSTSLPQDRMVSSLALFSSPALPVESSSFEKSFNQLELKGESNDWKEIRRRCDLLSSFEGGELKEWTKMLTGLLDGILLSFPGGFVEERWSQFAFIKRDQRKESRLGGWIASFCAFDEEGNWQLEDGTVSFKKIPSGMFSLRFKDKSDGEEAAFDLHTLGRLMVVENHKTITCNVEWIVSKKNVEANSFQASIPLDVMGIFCTFLAEVDWRTALTMRLLNKSIKERFDDTFFLQMVSLNLSENQNQALRALRRMKVLEDMGELTLNGPMEMVYFKEIPKKLRGLTITECGNLTKEDLKQIELSPCLEFLCLGQLTGDALPPLPPSLKVLWIHCPFTFDQGSWQRAKDWKVWTEEEAESLPKGLCSLSITGRFCFSPGFFQALPKSLSHCRFTINEDTRLDLLPLSIKSITLCFAMTNGVDLIDKSLDYLASHRINEMIIAYNSQLPQSIRTKVPLSVKKLAVFPDDRRFYLDNTPEHIEHLIGNLFSQTDQILILPLLKTICFTKELVHKTAYYWYKQQNETSKNNFSHILLNLHNLQVLRCQPLMLKFAEKLKKDKDLKYSLETCRGGESSRYSSGFTFIHQNNILSFTFPPGRAVPSFLNLAELPHNY